MPTPPPPAPPSWYNASWLYRKSVGITGRTGAGTNYQMRYWTHYGSNLCGDSGDDVYLNSHSRTDFADVIFTAADGVTELSFWQDPNNTTSSDHSVFWVNVPADLGSDQTIYIYYGNSGKTPSDSNGANTFPDGFLSGASPAEMGDIWAATSEYSGTNYINGSQNQITVGADLGQTKAGRNNTFDVKMLNAFNLQNVYVGGCSEVHFGSISGHNVEVLCNYYTATLDSYNGYWTSFVFIAFKFADGTYMMAGQLVWLKTDYEWDIEGAPDAYSKQFRIVSIRYIFKPTGAVAELSLNDDLISSIPRTSNISEEFNKIIKVVDTDFQTKTNASLKTGGGDFDPEMKPIIKNYPALVS